MLKPIPAEVLRIGSGRTRRFVGREHGASLSYFFVDNDPGQGPELHRHPYTETWIVLEGEADVTIGDRVMRATAGDTVTAQLWTWHRFVNCGTSRLRIVCMHASPVIIQEWWDSRGTLDIPSLTD
ncbi:cupin domain-containing protein [Microbacterium sp. zg-YB36]|uniref:cupin domain-containing protein n=1 Tax=Microbacterium sp. zg-YB36 TaxID=2969407 RepID=UPI00214CC189|nr:cupin domain-containing protein [Microbacterium sp. zg-YB36]MDL5350858.1 cupin domain-containing protein [Microbacterium sp. zg-YB36]